MVRWAEEALQALAKYFCFSHWDKKKAISEFYFVSSRYDARDVLLFPYQNSNSTYLP